MKIDQTTLLILAAAGIGGWFLFRNRTPAAQRSSTIANWGRTYTDTRGREVVEGFDTAGNPKSYITIDTASRGNGRNSK
jgi:hypothetical protein